MIIVHGLSSSWYDEDKAKRRSRYNWRSLLGCDDGYDADDDDNDGVDSVRESFNFNPINYALVQMKVNELLSRGGNNDLLDATLEKQKNQHVLDMSKTYLEQGLDVFVSVRDKNDVEHKSWKDMFRHHLFVSEEENAVLVQSLMVLRKKLFENGRIGSNRNRSEITLVVKDIGEEVGELKKLHEEETNILGCLVAVSLTNFLRFCGPLPPRGNADGDVTSINKKLQKLRHIKAKERVYEQFTLNDEQRFVTDSLLNNLEEEKQLRMLVHGGPGTGKSQTIAAIQELFNELGYQCFVSAFTGVAAENIGGCTLHHLLGINMHQSGAYNEISMNQKMRVGNKFAKCNLLIIDEISFVSASFLYAKISELLKKYTGESAVDFGNCNIMLFGDFLQIPPVRDRSIIASMVKVTTNEIQGKQQQIFCW